MTATFRFEGLGPTLENMKMLSRATNRNVCRRALRAAAEPIAHAASQASPHETGKLAFSIAISPTLSRRHKADQARQKDIVEMFVGPAGGVGSLFYATWQEFGTIRNPAHPYLRPAWDGQHGIAHQIIISQLKIEVAKAAARAQRKIARQAARAR